ncbi:tetratricopeptide repeat protein [Micromonospora sp. NPDC004551]|uniref:tetratricopeptide repeat protein n=1 Tax=Micromonospora sp. NPDC004551 TaxID=3154284 RepID=UPI0033A7EC09
MGETGRAADYAPGAMHRVSVGVTGNDLEIAWRVEPQQVVGPRLVMAQRLYQARQHAGAGNQTRSIEFLRAGLLQIDPNGDDLALDTATAQVAALLARLTLTGGDPYGALPWAAWAHRSLRRVLRSALGPETRAALKVLAAAHRAVGDVTAAVHSYSDLTRHQAQAEGPTALPTLAAQASLALVLYEEGHCEQAQQLLARTIAIHRRAHREHPARARMAAALDHMRATCAGHPHEHPAGVEDAVRT